MKKFIGPTTLTVLTILGLTAGAMTVGTMTVEALRAGKGIAYAQETGAAQSNQSSLVQKIATRFSLKESDVQSVFDENQQARRAEMQSKMQTELNDRLSKAVADGKLTEAQKQLVLAKHAELQSQMAAEKTAMKDKTPEERRAAMEARRTALESWATQNNIDISYVVGGKGGMMGTGDGVGMGNGRRGMMGEGRFDQ